MSAGTAVRASVPGALPKLRPGATIGISRSGSNPTFNFNSLPETVVKVGSTYWCAYQIGSNGTVGLASASSIDGSWTAYGSNPILSAGSGWEAGGPIYAPHLLQEGGTFYLFYGIDDGGATRGIGYATASTVTGPYTKSGSNPILSPGTAGAWDDYRVGEPSITKAGSTYYMAYMGEKTAYQTTERIGMATASSLGGPWTKNGSNPILAPGTSGQWDDFFTADPEIFYENGLFWLSYAGTPGPTAGDFPWGTGFAYSADGTTFTRHASNPFITASGSGFDLNGAFRGSVYHEDGYHVIYTGVPTGAANLTTMKGGNATLTLS